MIRVLSIALIVPVLSSGTVPIDAANAGETKPGLQVAQADVPAAPAPAAPPPAPPAATPAAVPPATNPAPAPGTPAAGTPAAVLDEREVDGILGKSIRASSGENMGRIVDVIVSRAGHVRGAVIDFGGFLGVGSRKIAVDWSVLRFDGEKPSVITADMTKDQLRMAPEYKSGEAIVLLGAAVPAAAPRSPPPPDK
ncbi:PRC-barrel domain-containing protein [Rhodoplanes roseus]|uniref:PRC-barrel domain-containing protein n=1 Tax=Rhodoplanes roseus TaxID=29409 RepID=A0A327KZQ7_9BRAD|nr:PRC-barrel domain-containing protein [Rhodoplanes roseus]RAI43637.1 hypothetical protein CH341_13225 [Rhodoplanes roseus]